MYLDQGIRLQLPQVPENRQSHILVIDMSSEDGVPADLRPGAEIVPGDLGRAVGRLHGALVIDAPDNHRSIDPQSPG